MSSNGLPSYPSADEKSSQPQPQPQPPAPVVTYSQPGPGAVVGTSEYPVNITCPSCNTTITTVTNKKNGLLTWLLSCGLCVFGCWLGCCLIPFCVDDVKDTEHICPRCNRVVMLHKKI
ncbi:hypothetical protein MP638_003386 [Amoeboaphelidium occidentale]|nr:hypothetical protein MP638_003386 [Amoeboaphelidium occidentale]